MVTPQRGRRQRGLNFVQLLEEAFIEWDDFNEQQKSDQEKERDSPPEMPVPASYLESCFMDHKGWTQTTMEAQPDDYVWRERAIYDLRLKYHLL